MRRSAGSPDARLTRRRIVAGGATALAVTFTFVAANAIWYQPHAHKAPILATRAVEPGPVPVPIPVEREREAIEVAQPPARPSESPRQTGDADIASIIEDRTEPSETMQGGDPQVAEIQSVMADLGLYEGEVDGLSGPLTRAAIEAYQQTIGLEVTGRIDDTLLAKLGVAGEPAVPAPPAQRPERRDTDNVQTASLGGQGDSRVMRIQAGLRAFGNDGIEIDGMVGPRTEAAIREFQSLFGLPVTGEPDQALYVKMREIGLMD
jgi:peptidoglycan hydrolase-like protein with peptidoglycan-binding domain